MQDQVEHLKSKGIKAAALSGGLRYEEVDSMLDNCIYGNYKFLYLSPERLQQDIVLERIRQMPVNLIAIDEAHCISQWGNDFRPAYRNCTVLRELFPAVPVVALTASATARVVDDILENLHMKEATVFRKSFARSNLAYMVFGEEHKHYRLRQILKKTRSLPLCMYVTARLPPILPPISGAIILPPVFITADSVRRKKHPDYANGSTTPTRSW